MKGPFSALCINQSIVVRFSRRRKLRGKIRVVWCIVHNSTRSVCSCIPNSEIRSLLRMKQRKLGAQRCSRKTSSSLASCLRRTSTGRALALEDKCRTCLQGKGTPPEDSSTLKRSKYINFPIVLPKDAAKFPPRKSDKTC